MEGTATPVATVASPGAFHVEKVLWVRHWTETYFSFGITRPPSFRFRSGEFVMLGLLGTPKPITRAYSIASPAYADALEFFSIKVPDGPLTSRLQRIDLGDDILLGRKPTGTLVLDALRPGKRLWLVGTGTGLAPWLAVARDPEVYDRFEHVIVTHTVRCVQDLAYRDFLEREILEDKLLGELVMQAFRYYPTVTREPFKYPGRFTDRLVSGDCFRDLELPFTELSPDNDRLMLCGSMAMIKELGARLEARGFVEGSNAEPGDFVLERAFVS
jgi:ferredoxin--NADP+ reductase